MRAAVKVVTPSDARASGWDGKIGAVLLLQHNFSSSQYYERLRPVRGLCCSAERLNYCNLHPKVTKFNITKAIHDGDTKVFHWNRGNCLQGRKSGLEGLNKLVKSIAGHTVILMDFHGAIPEYQRGADNQGLGVMLGRECDIKSFAALWKTLSQECWEMFSEYKRVVQAMWMSSLLKRAADRWIEVESNGKPFLAAHVRPYADGCLEVRLVFYLLHITQFTTCHAVVGRCWTIAEHVHGESPVQKPWPRH